MRKKTGKHIRAAEPRCHVKDTCIAQVSLFKISFVEEMKTGEGEQVFRVTFRAYIPKRRDWIRNISPVSSHWLLQQRFCHVFLGLLPDHLSLCGTSVWLNHKNSCSTIKLWAQGRCLSNIQGYEKYKPQCSLSWQCPQYPAIHLLVIVARLSCPFPAALRGQALWLHPQESSHPYS